MEPELSSSVSKEGTCLASEAVEEAQQLELQVEEARGPVEGEGATGDSHRNGLCPTSTSSIPSLLGNEGGSEAEIAPVKRKREPKTKDVHEEYRIKMRKLRECHKTDINQTTHRAKKNEAFALAEQQRRHDRQLKDSETTHALLSAHNKRLAEEVQYLWGRNRSLEREIGRLGAVQAAGERSLAASLSVPSQKSGPSPVDMQRLADRTRDCLEDFTEALMCKPGTRELKHGARKLASALFPSSIRDYGFQTLISDVVFSGFESQDFRMADFLPAELGWEKLRAHKYKHFKELESDSEFFHRVATKMLQLLSAQQSDVKALQQYICLPDCQRDAYAGEECGCSRMNCFLFCYRKAMVMRQTAPLVQFWNCPLLQDVDAVEEWNRIVGSKLLSLLICVWLSHLLASSFKHPCSLIKVKAKSDFDAGYMVKKNQELDPVGCNPVPQKVAFMILPGFRIGASVVRSHVCLVPGLSSPDHEKLVGRAALTSVTVQQANELLPRTRMQMPVLERTHVLTPAGLRGLQKERFEASSASRIQTSLRWVGTTTASPGAMGQAEDRGCQVRRKNLEDHFPT